jgi:hypothetical protein
MRHGLDWQRGDSSWRNEGFPDHVQWPYGNYLASDPEMLKAYWPERNIYAVDTRGLNLVADPDEAWEGVGYYATDPIGPERISLHQRQARVAAEDSPYGNPYIERCRALAYQHALNTGGRYVEGMGRAQGVWHPHAWVERDGQVIDPAWGEGDFEYRETPDAWWSNAKRSAAYPCPDCGETMVEYAMPLHGGGTSEPMLQCPRCRYVTDFEDAKDMMRTRYDIPQEWQDPLEQQFNAPSGLHWGDPRNSRVAGPISDGTDETGPTRYFRGLYLGQIDPNDDAAILGKLRGREGQGFPPEMMPTYPLYGQNWTSDANIARRFALNPSAAGGYVDRPSTRPGYGVVIEAHSHVPHQPDLMNKAWTERQVTFPHRDDIQRVIAHLHGPEGYVRSLEVPEQQWRTARISKETPNQLRRRYEQIDQQFGPPATQVVHTTPDGWTVHRLPGKEARREGLRMRNCWQSGKPYINDVKWGASHPDMLRFMSLRDPQGVSHANWYEPRLDQIEEDRQGRFAPRMGNPGERLMLDMFGPRNESVEYGSPPYHALMDYARAHGIEGNMFTRFKAQPGHPDLQFKPGDVVSGVYGGEPQERVIGQEPVEVRHLGNGPPRVEYHAWRDGSYLPIQGGQWTKTGEGEPPPLGAWISRVANELPWWETDIADSTLKARCPRCGGDARYQNDAYHCLDCGYVLRGEGDEIYNYPQVNLPDARPNQWGPRHVGGIPTWPPGRRGWDPVDEHGALAQAQAKGHLMGPPKEYPNGSKEYQCAKCHKRLGFWQGRGAMGPVLNFPCVTGAGGEGFTTPTQIEPGEWGLPSSDWTNGLLDKGLQPNYGAADPAELAWHEWEQEHWAERRRFMPLSAYEKRDRVELKGQPGKVYEVFSDGPHGDKGYWLQDEDDYNNMLRDVPEDAIAGHTTIDPPHWAHNPFHKLATGYVGPLTLEGYHNSSHEGVEGVRREGFDFSRHKRGTWGTGAYAFLGSYGEGKNPGGPGEASTPIRLKLNNGIHTVLDQVGAVDRHDPGTQLMEGIWRQADAWDPHSRREALLNAGYDGVMVSKYMNHPYVAVAFDHPNYEILNDRVRSGTGLMAVGGEDTPRPGEYRYVAGEKWMAQNPTGTFAHTSGMTLPQEQRAWNQDVFAKPWTGQQLDQLPNGWTVHQMGSPDDVHKVGRFMRNCWQSTQPEHFEASSANGWSYHTMHDEHGLPRIAFYVERNPHMNPHLDEPKVKQALGMRNEPLTPEQDQLLGDWASSQGYRYVPPLWRHRENVDLNQIPGLRAHVSSVNPWKLSGPPPMMYEDSDIPEGWTLQQWRAQNPLAKPPIIHCPNCQAGVRADLGYCPQCRTPLIYTARTGAFYEDQSYLPNGTHQCVNCDQTFVRQGPRYRPVAPQQSVWTTHECPQCQVPLAGRTVPRHLYQQDWQVQPRVASGGCPRCGGALQMDHAHGLPRMVCPTCMYAAPIGQDHPDVALSPHEWDWGQMGTDYGEVDPRALPAMLPRQGASEEEGLPEPAWHGMFDPETGEMRQPEPVAPLFEPGTPIVYHNPLGEQYEEGGEFYPDRLHGAQGYYIGPDRHYPGAHHVNFPGHGANWVMQHNLRPRDAEDDPTWQNFWHGKTAAPLRPGPGPYGDSDVRKIEIDPAQQPLIQIAYKDGEVIQGKLKRIWRSQLTQPDRFGEWVLDIVEPGVPGATGIYLSNIAGWKLIAGQLPQPLQQIMPQGALPAGQPPIAAGEPPIEGTFSFSLKNEEREPMTGPWRISGPVRDWMQNAFHGELSPAPTPEELAQGRMCAFHPERPAVTAYDFAARCAECEARHQQTKQHGVPAPAVPTRAPSGIPVPQPPDIAHRMLPYGLSHRAKRGRISPSSAGPESAPARRLSGNARAHTPDWKFGADPYPETPDMSSGADEDAWAQQVEQEYTPNSHNLTGPEALVPWAMGKEAKGLVMHDGSVVTWQHPFIHHPEVAQMLGPENVRRYINSVDIDGTARLDFGADAWDHEAVKRAGLRPTLDTWDFGGQPNFVAPDERIPGVEY